MKETISLFVEDFSLMFRWFYPVGKERSFKEIESMYQVIRTMWFDYRDVFPNKGTYKTVRRLFIKHAAEFYIEHRYKDDCSNISRELFQEMVFKARQEWAPKYVLRYLKNVVVDDNRKRQTKDAKR